MVWQAAAIGAGAGLLGGFLDRRESSQQASANRQLQYDFAQQGIQWRVADAEKAGVHPLYAIGANIPTYSPVRGSYGHLGRAVAGAGQAIGDYLSKAALAEERAEDRAMLRERHRLESLKTMAEIRGQNIANANANRTPVRSASGLPGQQTMGFWSGPGSPRVLYHPNPVGRLVPYYLEPGEAGHQDLEDAAGNIYAEVVSGSRALMQRARRRKYGPTGAKRWRSRVRVESVGPGRKNPANRRKRTPSWKRRDFLKSR